MNKNFWKYSRLRQILKLKTYWLTKMDVNRNFQLLLFKKFLKYLKKLTFLQKY